MQATFSGWFFGIWASFWVPDGISDRDELTEISLKLFEIELIELNP